MVRLKPDQLRAAREAKQKKLLIALAPLLLGLLAWQGPKTYNALAGDPPPPPVVVGSTTTAPTDPSTAPPPSTATGGNPSPPAAEGGLPDTDVPPAGGDGQLVSFSRFTGKDPFEQPSSSSGTGDGSTGEGDSGGQAANTAVLAVNGETESVKIGSSFPASDPTFRLVSISGDTATVGLVAGSFSNGADTIDVEVGETLVLVADPDGKRYAIKLESVAFVE